MAVGPRTMAPFFVSLVITLFMGTVYGKPYGETINTAFPGPTLTLLNVVNPPTVAAQKWVQLIVLDILILFLTIAPLAMVYT